jgi:SAM-dependent methyltransferase
MRNEIKHFVQIVAETLPVEAPIYEFGALQVPGQEGFADLRPLFPGKEYVGCDMLEGPGVDRVLNLYDMDLPDETAGTVICADTLEHTEYPHKAMQEAHRVLKRGGFVAISSVMDYPIHSSPYDYWRFTPEGFKSILQPFETVIVESHGPRIFPQTVVGVGVKGPVEPARVAELQRKLDAWKALEFPHWTSFAPRNWKDTAKLFIPPILVEVARKARGR